MEPSGTTDSSTVTYQVPRDALIRVWWRRVMLQPQRLIVIALLAVLIIACFSLRNGLEYAGIVLLTFLIMMPISLYRVLVRTVDGNPQFTDIRTLEFSPSRLVITGPDWKAEMPWTQFKGFSEDETWFYLDIAGNGLASVIPKSAFTSEQQEKFREYALSLQKK